LYAEIQNGGEMKKIYLLVYAVDDCECHWTEPIVGCEDEKKLEEYKKEIERKSAKLREKIQKLEDQKWSEMGPINNRHNELIRNRKKMDISEFNRKRRELTEKMTQINQKFYKDKNALLTEVAMEEDYFIDDANAQSLYIEELRILE
jgi:hypothetical protein